MNTKRTSWKHKALSATALAATALAAAAGYSTIHANSDQSATTFEAFKQRGGRGGRGGSHHIQGLDTNPPAVELAPAQSAANTTQATEKAADAAYYDGQYYGDPVAAGRWGTMQVVAVVEAGKLVDVQIANYPRSTYESDIITRNALPTLISEAITAQESDGVNFVSRATDSSRAFVKSLESALLDAALGVDL